MEARLKTTVAICTHNGGSLLPEATASAATQEVPADAFEVLIVDNASDETTAQVAQDLTARWPQARVVREEKRGLGHARNRAIAEARGEWIVFIDDDARMLPGYLEALARLANEECALAAAGGPIEIGWLGPVPPWYEPPLDALFNRLDHASYRMDLRYPRILYGTNMAFPLATLQAAGGFRTDLIGPDGRITAEADDEDVLLRIETGGLGRVVWEPGLRVRHYVQPARLTPEYIAQKAWRTGYARAVVERAYPGHGGVSRAIAGLGEWAARRFWGRGKGPLADRAQLETARGYLKGWRAK